MKKLLLSLALLCSAASASQAGQLQGVTLNSPASVVVQGGYTQLSLQHDVLITNNSGRSLRLGLQRQIQQDVAGADNNFCFGPVCYPPTVTTSPGAFVVPNGTTTQPSQMLLDYQPNNNPGIAIIRYALFEVGTNDSLYVTVRFDATRATLAAAGSKATESVLSQPWPNPASATTELNFQLPAGAAKAGSLVLVSLADGRRVRQINIGTQSGTSFASATAGCSIGNGCLVTPSAKVVGGGVILVDVKGLAPGFYSCLLLNGAEGRGQLLAARRLLVQ